MIFDTPMVLHSRNDDGRHWFTTLDYPPLQIIPVAANHCRVGQSLALLISAMRAEPQPEGAEALEIKLEDLERVPNFAHRFKRDLVSPDGVRVDFEIKRAEGRDENGDLDEDTEFLTPVPSSDHNGSYDDWIYKVTAALGFEPPIALSAESYDQVLSEAIKLAQARVPGLRERYLAGMDGLSIGFKVALTTKSGGTEYVWTHPIDWQEPDRIKLILDSQPYDCPGYISGQEMDLSVSQIVDYAIGSEAAGLVDPGVTQRVAEDYGDVLA